MPRIRVRITPLLALTMSAGLSLTANGCGSSNSASDHKSGDSPPMVVATTTWEGALAKAAGAEDVKVIVPSSVQHAPDYDPRASDLTAVAHADYVLYAPFEPYAKKLKAAAGTHAKLVELDLDNDAGKTMAEVMRLGGVFGTQSAAAKWNNSFKSEYGTLQKGLKDAWPGGKVPSVVAQVYSVWAAEMAGADVAGTYGPEAVTARQLSELSQKKPELVLDNVHMTTGTVLPGSGARQVEIVNYPGKDLDLLTVYRDAAATVKKAMTAP
ncbi:ABC transporter substrate-binding protein [Streptomyces sp. NRRL B-1568]|nr:ABC transporter substrate-binding protein [Streptomyces sp. NRRL B-1568]